MGGQMNMYLLQKNLKFYHDSLNIAFSIISEKNDLNIQVQ